MVVMMHHKKGEIPSVPQVCACVCVCVCVCVRERRKIELTV